MSARPSLKDEKKERQILDDNMVAATTGSGVSDYSAETEAAGGCRTLDVQFRQDFGMHWTLILRIQRLARSPARNGGSLPHRL